MCRKAKIIGLLTLMLCIMGVVDLSAGGMWILPLSVDKSFVIYRILMEIRLPRVMTAILAGIALSESGLLMQTLFRNPLAGPYILGVSSGAGLGVAILTMCSAFVGAGILGSWSVAAAAIAGSACVLLLVLAVAKKVTHTVSLLIVGMMIGSVAGALVNLIQNFANPDALKLFIVWTLGSLSGVGWTQMPIMAGVCVLGLILIVVLIKPLNGLLLGDEYAQGLGVDVQRTRLCMVLATGLLAGGVTAFTGPIAFVGVAVPHIARGLVRCNDHKWTVPVSGLVGANLLLICDFLCNIGTYPLPISTMSALFGAPIIIWIILRGK